MLQNEEFLEEVGRWVHFWRTKPSQWFPSYLERMTWFEPTVDSVLAAHELPWSLRYLPIIESGYSPTAVSSARAVGMWQFMAATALEQGLEVDEYMDERRDPFESTEAAADFLVELRRDFGSWFLALAAYNAGPQRIRGILDRYAPGAEPSDSLYWAIRERLPQETRDFVPNLFGAIVVAQDPPAHGYEVPVPAPFVFDSVLVVANTTLAGVAQAAETTPAEVERLNPQYIRGTTPPDRSAWVRIPVGTLDVLRGNVAQTQEGDPGS
jgi:membrane-bound lytic murein transglycosylase D